MVRSSHQMNVASMITALAIATSIVGDVQPDLWPLVNASSRVSIAPVDSAAPSQSNFLAWPSWAV